MDLSKVTKATLEKAVDEYFARCKRKSLSCSMTGLALHLGVTRLTLINYQKTDIFGDILERAKLRCENLLEERMIAGVAPTGMIFILKNNYGWTDKIDVNQTINGRLSISALFDEAQKLRSRDTEPQIEGEIVREEVPVLDLLPDNLF
jgi:hypothetical protein